MTIDIIGYIACAHIKKVAGKVKLQCHNCQVKGFALIGILECWNSGKMALWNDGAVIPRLIQTEHICDNRYSGSLTHNGINIPK